MTSPHEAYMQEAIALAKQAAALDEVPIGALVVYEGRIIARAHNLRETNRMATAHAELLAIEEACRVRGGWRLHGCTLYVTLEPCAMCAGAAINARIDRIVYGAYDQRFGALGSLLTLTDYPFNHIPQVEGGICQEDCRTLLQDYFKGKRKPAPTLP